MTSWHIEKLTYWEVDILRRWYVDKLTSWCVDMLASWQVGMLKCRNFDILTFCHIDTKRLRTRQSSKHSRQIFVAIYALFLSIFLDCMKWGGTNTIQLLFSLSWPDSHKPHFSTFHFSNFDKSFLGGNELNWAQM